MRRCLEGIIEDGWKTLEEIKQLEENKPAFCHAKMSIFSSEQPLITRVKELIELELVINKQKVALFMNIFSQTAQEINVKIFDF